VIPIVLDTDERSELTIASASGLRRVNGYVVPATNGIIAAIECGETGRWSVTHVPTGSRLTPWVADKISAMHVGLTIYRKAIAAGIRVESTDLAAIQPWGDIISRALQAPEFECERRFDA
jgi:hypothetical protein